MSLVEDSCARLREHFAALKASRDGKSQGPVYALEHPLTEHERVALTMCLRNVRKKEGLRTDHWLAWIVVATEFGYSYSGWDYWPRLEAKIPDWQYSDRNRLTGWFERFAREYGGARTSGAWARQFCMIAWPITHAILPTDLQVQLSRAIYSVRHHLFGIDDRSDAELGGIVANRWVPHGERFERLMQREQFVGTLVRMLLQPNSDADAISHHALRRILSDVESHADAHLWLRDARALCKPTAKVSAPAQPMVRDNATLRPRFSPNLVLRKDKLHRWGLGVKPGSVIGLIADAPQLKKSLARLQYAVAGNDAQAFPATDLDKAEPRERPLWALPTAGTPVLRFLPLDDPDAVVLTRDCVLAPRDLWLFKMRSDGLGWLQSAPTVIVGSTYLFASADPERPLPGTPVETTVPGLRLSQAQIPLTLSNAEATALQAAGLTVAKRTTLRPWGVLPRVWRDDGLAEYVLAEPILLQVERDHDFDAIRVCIDKNAAEEHSCPQLGSFLLEIAGLPLGSHRIAVDTLVIQRSGSVTTTSTLASAALQIHVRPPSAWHPGALPAEALAVALAPAEPTLDQLLQGRVAVAVDGTAGDTIKVSLAIVDSRGERHDRLIVRRRPPLSAAEWHQKLEVELRKPDVSLFALAATHAHLAIGSDNFGCHRAELAVFPRPLRWGVEARGSDFVLRLHVDAADTPQVTFYPRYAPCTAQGVAFDAVYRGTVGRDGLYVACVGECTAALVVSCPPVKISLDKREALGAPHVDERDPSRLLESLCRWVAARVIGRLPLSRQASVIDALHSRLVLELAGTRWSNAERHLASHGSLADLDTVVEPRVRNYGINLGRCRGLQDIAQLKDNFIRTSTAYGITTDPRRADFAWRVVFEPRLLCHEHLVADAFADPTLPALIRGARLIELGLNAGKKS